jgi:hypothetical protein
METHGRYFHADGFGKDFKILNIDGQDSSQADGERRPFVSHGLFAELLPATTPV